MLIAVLIRNPWRHLHWMRDVETSDRCLRQAQAVIP